MYRTVADFVEDWNQESASTLRVLRALTDRSLDQRVNPDGRTLGRLAWHITETLGEMLSKTGLTLDVVSEHAPQPSRAAEIAREYERSARAVGEGVRQAWTDADLEQLVPMYGEEWKKGVVLAVLVKHQAHHRGQMTVLMRQAGLAVPGVYGPAREEWAAMGIPAMA